MGRIICIALMVVKPLSVSNKFRLSTPKLKYLKIPRGQKIPRHPYLHRSFSMGIMRHHVPINNIIPQSHPCEQRHKINPPPRIENIASNENRHRFICRRRGIIQRQKQRQERQTERCLKKKPYSKKSAQLLRCICFCSYRQKRFSHQTKCRNGCLVQ